MYGDTYHRISLDTQVEDQLIRQVILNHQIHIKYLSEENGVLHTTHHIRLNEGHVESLQRERHIRVEDGHDGSLQERRHVQSDVLIILHQVVPLDQLDVVVLPLVVEERYLHDIMVDAR